MTTVRIDNDNAGWYHTATTARYETYDEAVAAARAGGFEVDNAGWLHRLLAWNWHSLAFTRYKGWEISDTKVNAPAFVKLAHKRGKEGDDVESHALSVKWDDVATVGFYQRDWTDDGIPYVRAGDTYWSGWWFQTIAERERFIQWLKPQKGFRIEEVK